MIRTKVDFYPKGVEALHYYALLISSSVYSHWELREYLPFRKQFSLAEKARSMILYDHVINNELPTWSTQ